jgi:hypothetical protein
MGRGGLRLDPRAWAATRMDPPASVPILGVLSCAMARYLHADTLRQKSRENQPPYPLSSSPSPSSPSIKHQVTNTANGGECIAPTAVIYQALLLLCEPVCACLRERCVLLHAQFYMRVREVSLPRGTRTRARARASVCVVHWWVGAPANIDQEPPGFYESHSLKDIYFITDASLYYISRAHPSNIYYLC